MDEQIGQSVSEALRALANGSKRGVMRQLRGLLSDIELAQESGATNQEIVETLNERLGLQMDYGFFGTCLYRLRKEKNKLSAASAERGKKPAEPLPKPSEPKQTLQQISAVRTNRETDSEKTVSTVQTANYRNSLDDVKAALGVANVDPADFE